MLTGDSIVNGIPEKGLSVIYKVKIVNLPGSTSEMILNKLDDIIKEKPEDLIFHARTNDITNNVNLSINVKKIFNNFSKESPLTSIEFPSIINRKDKTNIQKTLTDTNTRLKNFRMQKGISFIDNSGIKEFHFNFISFSFYYHLLKLQRAFIKHFGYYVRIDGEA